MLAIYSPVNSTPTLSLCLILSDLSTTLNIWRHQAKSNSATGTEDRKYLYDNDMIVTKYYLVFLRYKYRPYTLGTGVLLYIRNATEYTSTDNDNNTQRR